MLLCLKPQLRAFAGALTQQDVRSALLFGLLEFVDWPILPNHREPDAKRPVRADIKYDGAISAQRNRRLVPKQGRLPESLNECSRKPVTMFK